MTDDEVIDLAERISFQRGRVSSTEYNVNCIRDSENDLLSDNVTCILQIDNIKRNTYHTFRLDKEISLIVLDHLKEKESTQWNKEAKDYYNLLKENNIKEAGSW